MPPVQVITDDTMSSMIRFRTSTIYEMIVSLRTILRPLRRSQWANQARAQLSEDFMAEVTYLYDTLELWIEYLELPIDYPNQHDVTGFIEYVRNMPALDFVFYIIGRRLPRHMIEANGLDSAKLVHLIQERFGKYCHNMEVEEMPLTIVLQDVSAFQNRLAGLWQNYWDNYFHSQVQVLENNWNRGLSANEHILTHKGTEELFMHLTGKAFDAPPELPPGQPVTEIVLIPLYLIPHRAFMFYGYGNMTVLFDSEHTEDRVEEIKRRRDESLSTLRALGDPTRLKILRLIAQGEGWVNGKKIAHKLEMSASAVSRHLAQLRDSGLITEEPLDHRNITYRLKKETITDIPTNILDYLYS